MLSKAGTWTKTWAETGLQLTEDSFKFIAGTRLAQLGPFNKRLLNSLAKIRTKDG